MGSGSQSIISRGDWDLCLYTRQITNLLAIMIDKESMTMELWDLYDEQGQKTGKTWERSRAREIPEGRYHIVCDILIRHQDGEFLLTLRDPDKDIYPGCLEASAGGSTLAGEIPEDAARREMLEETGLTADKLELIGTTFKPLSDLCSSGNSEVRKGFSLTTTGRNC